MELIDGNETARQIIDELTKEVATLEGPPPASPLSASGKTRIRLPRKQEGKTAAKIGIESRLQVYPDAIGREALLEIDALNAPMRSTASSCRPPTPPLKRDGGLQPRGTRQGRGRLQRRNVGRMCQEDDGAFTACTPAGILELLKRSRVKTEGKRAVVLGRSLIVGKPAGSSSCARVSPATPP